MTNIERKTYLELRLIVGFLGERSQLNWWPTAFFESSSRLFLEPIFARTTKLAQYHGIREAARCLHDEHIGIGGVFHLFRLPEEIEQDLHRLMLEMQHDAHIHQLLSSKEAALEALADMMEESSAMTEGPIKIGQMHDLLTVIAQKTVAGAYYTAFTKGLKTYPYFVVPT